MASVWGTAWGAAFGAAFGVVQPAEPPAPVDVPAQVRPVGGAHYDAGRGYIKQDHGWVKATKAVKYGASDHWSGEAGSTVKAEFVSRRFGVQVINGSAVVSGGSAVSRETIPISCAYGSVLVESRAQGETQCLAHGANVAKVETLGIDEIIAILEFTDQT